MGYWTGKDLRPGRRSSINSTQMTAYTMRIEAGRGPVKRGVGPLPGAVIPGCFAPTPRTARGREGIVQGKEVLKLRLV